MDAILGQEPFFILSNSNIIDDEEDYDDETEIISTWVKDKDIIRASIEIEKLDKLTPGTYTVEYNRDIGLYCKAVNSKSDELFLFTDSIVNNLLTEINLFWSKSDLYKNNNLIHKRGILLEGYPGTGKSSIITILSNEIMKLGGVVFKVNGFRNLDHYIAFIRTQFRKIQPETPIITILEDIDQYDDVESELLDFLDGKTNLDHHVIIGTTNNTENIPNTFLRPSRIDLRLEIPLPCEQTRKEYFQYKNVPITDISELVEKSDGFSLADLKELYICIYLLDYTVEDAINKISNPSEKKSYMCLPKSTSKLGI